MTQPIRRVLITGANGFIGKNLKLRLTEMPGFLVHTFVRGDDTKNLSKLVAQSDVVVHLAGENRPSDQSAFFKVNAGLTVTLCDFIRLEKRATGREIKLLLASSTQALIDNPYGRSKLSAEQVAQSLAMDIGTPVSIFRLPGVFGKWCKPHYNSVVATFCYNLARGLPVKVDDSKKLITLVYIDDVVKSLINEIQVKSNINGLVKFQNIRPEYKVTLGNLFRQIESFAISRSDKALSPVWSQFSRILYSTYLSYLPINHCHYPLVKHSDQRGDFVEILKTKKSGQFSFFTIKPFLVRGGHYHHTKTEKFLVVKGVAKFRFKHVITNEFYEIVVSDKQFMIVDIIPGWSHDITNLGDDELIVFLWANEVFDEQNPDTIFLKVSHEKN